jgi:hypothetical protein
MADCSACGQELLTRPTRCDVCKGSISPNQAFEHDRIEGVCTPRHRDCERRQAALL